MESDDDDRPLFISITARDLRDVPELRAKLGRQSQVEAVLGEAGKMLTVEEIREALMESEIKMSTGAVRAELNRGLKNRTFVSVRAINADSKATRWGLGSRDREPN